MWCEELDQQRAEPSLFWQSGQQAHEEHVIYAVTDRVKDLYNNIKRLKCDFKF